MEVQVIIISVLLLSILAAWVYDMWKLVKALGPVPVDPEQAARLKVRLARIELFDAETALTKVLEEKDRV